MVKRMERRVSRLPMSRAAHELIIERLPGEVLVYDQVHHRAHCLSEAAARVWEMCDGRRSTDEARAALAAVGTTESLETILANLTQAGLVRAPERVNRSRRRMLGKTAVAAGVVLASPVVYSILSPSVAQAASLCGKVSQPCCTTEPKCQAGDQFCLSGRCAR